MIDTNKEKTFKNRVATVLPVLAIGFALLLRFLLIPLTNYDTDGYALWYDYIAKHGIRYALRQNFWIYTPPYLYLLSLATLASNVISKLVAIKLIPICFDLINAGIIFKILRLKYPVGKIPVWGAAVFLLAPTVIMNSALWGQIDSFYTCFLLISIYLLLRNQPVASMITFGLGLSVKAQAAFVGPFLLLMLLKKRIPWYAAGMVPLSYLAAMLPAILAGRSVLDVSTVYLRQAAQLQIPSFNAPNWYVFVPQSTYAVSTPLGMILAVLIISAGVYIYSRRNLLLGLETILFIAFVSLAFMPFLLPKMHDRYFYPADVFSIILAFLIPQYWVLPLCYQLISGLAYSIFLFGAPRSITLVLATEVNTILITFLVWKQYRLLRASNKKNHWFSKHEGCTMEK